MQKQTRVLKRCYQVEYISKMKEDNGVRLFRVKWLGYPSCQNTWQPEDHLPPQLVASFFKEQKNKQTLRKQKKNRQKQTDNYYMPQTARRRIVNRSMEGNQIKFTISEGSKKSYRSRELLINEEPEELARYYLEVYLRGNQLVK